MGVRAFYWKQFSLLVRFHVLTQTAGFSKWSKDTIYSLLGVLGSVLNPDHEIMTRPRPSRGQRNKVIKSTTRFCRHVT